MLVDLKMSNKVFSQVREHINLFNKILTVEIDKNKKENLKKILKKYGILK